MDYQEQLQTESEKEQNDKNKKSFFTKKRAIYGVIALILVLITLGAFAQNNRKNQEQELAPVIKQVEIQEVSANQGMNMVEAIGIVKPETKVDIVALTHGTIEQVLVSEGDSVSAGSMLVSMYDSTVLTSLNNAMTSYSNAQNSYATTQSMASESVNQAQISVQNAQASVDAAEIGLQSAQDAYDNAMELQKRSNQDTKNNALISYRGYLNTVFDAIDQVNYIIKAEGSRQLPGIEHVLGVLNCQSKNDVKSAYQAAKVAYNRILQLEVNADNIEQSMEQMVDLLDKTEDCVDKTVVVLDKTVSHAGLPQASLNAQKSAFIGLRSSIVGSYNTALTTLNALQNMDSYNKQEKDALQSAVKTAEKQLELAKLGLENAQISLTNAKTGKEQQLISAQSAVDSAGGQVSLSQAQASYLNLTAPIDGQITYLDAEIGKDVNPGQKVAEVSRSRIVKIEIDLPSEQVYKVKPGQSVFINNTLNAVVTKVFPSADPVTKKVRVEIIFDNANQDLIAETFVDVIIMVDEIEEAVQKIYVPLKAISMSQTENFVFVYNAESKTAVKKAVEIGEVKENLIEIVSGLEKGEQLIVEGAKNGLEDGEDVEIIKELN